MGSNFNLESIFRKSLEEIDNIINSKEEHIREFDVPKNNGKGTRHIIEPLGEYKYILKGLNWKLLNMYRPHSAAKGFIKGIGIKQNAVKHIGQKSVGSIDIKDFFTNITRDKLSNVLFGNKRICSMCKHRDKMVEGQCSPSLYANKEKEFPHICEEIKSVYIDGYEENNDYQSLIRRMIDLMMFKGHTPQGFPTSPSISNIVLRGLDLSVEKFCEGKDIVYTRYADDLSFSSATMDRDSLRNIKGAIYNRIRGFNFEPNRAKTKFHGRGARMMVCGVVVNDKTSLPGYKVKKLRASVYRAVNDNRDDITEGDFRTLRGKVSYFKSVNHDKASGYAEQLKELAIYRGWSKSRA